MFIFSNLATSLDGKIATHDRQHFYLGTPADRREMQRLRKRADAVLMGASTLRAFKEPLAVRGTKKQPLNVVLSSSLKGVSPSWKFFKRKDIRRVLFTGVATPVARLRKFEGIADLAFLDPKKPLAGQIVRELERLGVKKLLIEGGGGVMWDFVREGLLEEINVTLTPWIVGGRDSPTLVEGEGFPAGGGQRLKIVRVKRVAQELFLTYRKT